MVIELLMFAYTKAVVLARLHAFYFTLATPSTGSSGDKSLDGSL